MPATPISAQSKGRFAVLDLLRFGAAIAVLGYHLSAYTKEIWGGSSADLFPHLSSVTKYGALGVELFFVISGFVILMSVHGRTIPQYVASRASRIFPGYWAAVFLGVLLFWVLWPEGREITLGQILSNLTMTQSASNVPHIDGVFWTLWVELRFYVIIGVFAYWGITRNRLVLFCTIWPVFAQISLHTESVVLEQLTLGRDASLFAGGMMIYFIYKWGWSYTAVGVLALNAFISANEVTGWLRHAMQNNTQQHISPTVLSLAVLLIFIVVAVAVLTPVRRIQVKWMTTLGLLTYLLYLVHEIWGWYFISHLAPLASPLVVLGLATLGVAALAVSIHVFVERPFASRMRRKIQRELEQFSQVEAEPSTLAQ